MDSTNKSFREIGPVRAALSAFAVQIVRDRVIQEAEIAVKPASGLHVSIKSKSDVDRTEWADIGATTVPQVAEIICETVNKYSTNSMISAHDASDM